MLFSIANSLSILLELLRLYFSVYSYSNCISSTNVAFELYGKIQVVLMKIDMSNTILETTRINYCSLNNAVNELQLSKMRRLSRKIKVGWSKQTVYDIESSSELNLTISFINSP